MTASLWQRAAAEALGTYALLVAGCGAIVVNAETGALGHVGIALTFGLVIGAMVASTGHVSGAHLNPAVTLSFALIRHFPLREIPAYIAAQLAGAGLGAATLLLLFGDVASLGATVPTGCPWRALGVEILATAMLMFVINAVATDTRALGEFAALAIGGAVALGALWAGPISGASMNPARSLGPALASGTWDQHWVYWLGPIAGALLGAGLYQVLKLTPDLPAAEAASRLQETADTASE